MSAPPPRPPDRAWVDAPPRDGVGDGGGRAAAAPVVKVVCYNILAEEYADEKAFPYTPAHALAWPYRLRAICVELVKRDADVVALQEVNGRAYRKQLAPFMARRGYEGRFAKKCGGDETEGTATFVRSAAFEVVEAHRHGVAQLAGDAGVAARYGGYPTPATAGGWSPEQAGAHEQLWGWLRGMPHTALSLVLRARQRPGASGGGGAGPAADGGARDDGAVAGGSDAELGDEESMGVAGSAHGHEAAPSSAPLLVVTNFHAYWNPRWPEVKAMQVALVVDAAARLRQRVDAAGAPAPAAGSTPLLLCGDFNSVPCLAGATDFDKEPGPAGWPMATGVYALLTSGGLAQAHPHHPASRRAAAGLPLDSVPALALPLRFESAYARVLGREPAWTNWHASFVDTLDYVFVATHARVDGGGDEGEGGAPWEALPGAPVAVAALEVPEDADVRALGGGAEGGCPNEGMPSDHIPLVVKLAWPALGRRWVA